MKHLRACNIPAFRLLRRGRSPGPEVVACSPLPRECTSTFAPGMEVGPDSTTGHLLCNPFLADTGPCSGSYWPAQRPDGTVQQTGSNWLSACGNLHNDWDKLPVVIPGTGAAAGKLWDTADKSDLANLCDVYIRDTWADTGAVPSPGNWWESPDIFFRRNRDDPSGFANTLIDYHQNPIRSQENWLYARIINRGAQQKIDHVLVRFYIAEPWSPNPTWKFIGHATAAGIAAGGVRVVRALKPYAPSVLGHACLMATLDSTQDPLGVGSWAAYDPGQGPQPADLKPINQDNNSAQRNIQVLALAPGWHAGHIWISLGNLLWKQGLETIDLEFEWPTLPRGTRAVLRFPDVPRERLEEIELGPRAALVRLPDGAAAISMAAAGRNSIWALPVGGWEREGPRRADLELVAGQRSVYLDKLRELQITELRQLADARLEPARIGAAGARIEKWTAQARALLAAEQRPLWMDLRIELPRRALPEMEHRIVVRQSGGGEILGGVTVVLKTFRPEWVRYVGDERRLVVHRAGCPDIRQLEESGRRPFDLLDAALDEGYEPDEKCARR